MSSAPPRPLPRRAALHLTSLLLLLPGLLVAGPAHGFGLRTHLYMAEQLLAELRRENCHIVVGTPPVRVKLDTQTCDDILHNEAAFRAGVLGPDIFPDVVVGQSVVHPGVDSGRQANEWLGLVLKAAKPGPETAFAYGQMVHAAGDVFAHSYVNNYAGGLFEITKRRHKDIEQRHFRLEKYIDQRLPFVSRDLDIKVPADLLVRSMVQTSYLGSKKDVTHELLRAALMDALMSAFKGGARSKETTRVLSGYLVRLAPAAHLTVMWGMIAAVENAPLPATCEDYTAVVTLHGAYNAYVEAERVSRGTPEIALEPPAAEGRCRDILAQKPDPNESAEARFARLLAAVEGELSNAEAAFERSRVATPALGWSDSAVNGRKEWWSELPRQNRRALAQSYDAYQRAAKLRNKTRAVRLLAPQLARDVRSAAQAYMVAGEEAARLMLRGGEQVPPGPEEKRSMVGPYDRWRACYIAVARGTPAEAAAFTCDRAGTLQADMSLKRTALLAGVGSMPRSRVYGFLEIQERLNEIAYDIVIQMTKLVSPSLAGLVNDIHDPVRIGRAELNKPFATARNGQIKLLCAADWIDADLGLMPRTPDGEIREDADCAQRAEPTAQFFDPADFFALQHALTLAKVALLDRDGVRGLARQMSGSDQDVMMIDGHDRYSVILDMARSLDGSHQWQGSTMPIPLGGDSKPMILKPAGYPTTGNPAAGEPQGFPFYRTDRLRRDVFARLFPKAFEGEILHHRKFDRTAYPYKPCQYDPFRTQAENDGATPFCVVAAPR